MFNIFVADTVWAKINDLENYLIEEYFITHDFYKACLPIQELFLLVPNFLVQSYSL